MSHMGGAFYGKIFSLIIVSMKDVIYYKIDNDRIFISIKNKNALIEIVTEWFGFCNLSLECPK